MGNPGGREIPLCAGRLFQRNEAERKIIGVLRSDSRAMEDRDDGIFLAR
jgi:hypothetical protein